MTKRKFEIYTFNGVPATPFEVEPTPALAHCDLLPVLLAPVFGADVIFFPSAFCGAKHTLRLRDPEVSAVAGVVPVFSDVEAVGGVHMKRSPSL